MQPHNSLHTRASCAASADFGGDRPRQPDGRQEALSDGTSKTLPKPESLPAPSPWPNANARLLGLGLGLPVTPLVRLAQFDDKEFERLTLEWADGNLSHHIEDVVEIQQRGGAGDKGRDIVVWIHPPGNPERHCIVYQCKHYAVNLGAPAAAGEIAKLLYYAYLGDLPVPRSYWFVTHRGLTNPFQDLLDDPVELRKHILTKWDDHCADAVSSKFKVALELPFREYVEAFDFSIFKAKQPQDLLNEHARTRYHLTVFGLPLIDRPPPATPPSTEAPIETKYIRQLYAVIGEALNTTVSAPRDFVQDSRLRTLFDRSRITFYFAEGLKELARDQMADPAFFTTLLDEFGDGLYHHYTTSGLTGLQRLLETVKASQALQLGSHVLAPHVLANDREGMCHQLANDDRLDWCEP